MNLITHGIRKQTAINALARLDCQLAGIPPRRFRIVGRQTGKTTQFNLFMWRIAKERAYLKNVIDDSEVSK